jgi:hypothetical protein
LVALYRTIPADVLDLGPVCLSSGPTVSICFSVAKVVPGSPARVKRHFIFAAALSLATLQCLPVIAEDPKPADVYHPKIVPNEFSIVIDNPFFTLSPGTTYTYESVKHKGAEVNRVVVTDKTRKVMGVTTRVVWDRVWLNDRLIEETYDWYAQDKEGNVWYFGEDSTEYGRDGKPHKEGSWEAGVNGAQPGIVMLAQPKPGEPYRQEYLKGEAEDMGQVESLNERVVVQLGTFTDCLKTKDWSALEPKSIEHKFYSREVGNLVLELEGRDQHRVELIAVTRGGSDQL